MNKTIELPVKEYHRLQNIEETFNALRQMFAHVESGLLETPPTTNTRTILKSLKATGKYSPAFLRSLSAGLKDSKTFTS